MCCDEKPDRKNTTTQRTGPLVSICKIKSAQERLLAAAVHVGSGVHISHQCVIDKSGFRERRESGRDCAQYLKNRATLFFVQDCKLLENVLLVMPEHLIYFGVAIARKTHLGVSRQIVEWPIWLENVLTAGGALTGDIGSSLSAVGQFPLPSRAVPESYGRVRRDPGGNKPSLAR